MYSSLTQVANATVQHALNLYYETAAHRMAVPNISLATDEPRPLYFFRGMLHFEPSDLYLDTLRSAGYAPHVFRFSREAEQNKLRQWRENTIDVIQYFVEKEELLETKPVFAGHSAGGLTAFVLGAIAKGASIVGLQSALPPLRSVPEERLRRLAHALKGSQFIAIASPLNGIQLNLPGRILNRTIVQPREPLLFTGITQQSLRKFYDEIGAAPEQVIDGSILSQVNDLGLGGGLASWASSAVVHGALRAFSPFLKYGSLSDGIVPLEAAALSGHPQVFLGMDHLRLVETSEAAQALAKLIRRAQMSSRAP